MKKRRKAPKKKATSSAKDAASKAPQTAEAIPDDKAGPPLDAPMVGTSPQQDGGADIAPISAALEVYRKAREALEQLSSVRTFEYWIAVCEGVGAAQTEAFAESETNDVKSDAFKKAHGKILVREGLDKTRLNPATRDQCLKILKHLPTIQKWHAGLNPVERLRVNHPSTVLKHWKKTAAGQDALFAEREASTGSVTKNKPVAQLKREVDRLTARLVEVEQERPSLVALVRGGPLKVQDAGDLTRDEFIAWLNRARQLADELPVAKRRSVN